jgi:hypothetical protein
LYFLPLPQGQSSLRRVVSQGERDAVTNEVHTLLAPFVMRHEVVSS